MSGDESRSSRSEGRNVHLKRVWVGGLDSRTTEDNLMDVFDQYGEVTDVKIRRGGRDIFAFIQYTNNADAEKAIQRLDQSFIKGKRVKVAWAEFKGTRRRSRSRGKPKDRSRSRSRSRGRHRRRSPSYSRRGRRSRSYSPKRRRQSSRTPPRRGMVPKGDYKIVIENIPPEMSWMDLKSMGRRYGDVTFARTWRDQESRRYFGILEFSNDSDREHAISSLDGHRINGFKVSAYKRRV